MKARGLIRNTSTITLALFIQKILSFGYFWLISNQLMHADLGRYVFALSFVSLFAIFIDLGITAIYIREASKDTSRAQSLLKNVIAIKIPLALLTLIAIFITAVFSGRAASVQNLIWLASIIIVLDAFTMVFWGTFRAYQNMQYEGVSILFVQIIILSLGTIVTLTTKNIQHLMLVLVVASVWNFSYALWLIKYKLNFSIWPDWHNETIRKLMKLVPAFALGGIFGKIYLTSDTVILGYLAGDAAVGLYSVPAKVTTSLSQIVPAAFASAIFPVFSKLYHHKDAALKKIFLQSFNYLVIVSLPMAILLSLLAPHILETFWPRYADITSTLIVMSLALPFIFLGFLTGYLLNACDHQKFNTYNRGVMALATVILNIVLIPLYHQFGAGITFLFVNSMVFILDYYWVKKITHINAGDIIPALTKIGLACILMVGTVLALRSQIHFILTAFVACVIYGAVIVVTNVIPWRLAKKTLKI